MSQSTPHTSRAFKISRCEACQALRRKVTGEHSSWNPCICVSVTVTPTPCSFGVVPYSESLVFQYTHYDIFKDMNVLYNILFYISKGSK
jgi:hypothetical protein